MGFIFLLGSATGITAYFNSATSSFWWWVIKLIFFVFYVNLLGNWNINEIIQGIAINFPSCTSWWANLDRWKITYFYSLPVCNVSRLVKMIQTTLLLPYTCRVNQKCIYKQAVPINLDNLRENVWARDHWQSFIKFTLNCCKTNFVSNSPLGESWWQTKEMCVDL